MLHCRFVYGAVRSASRDRVNGVYVEIDMQLELQSFERRFWTIAKHAIPHTEELVTKASLEGLHYWYSATLVSATAGSYYG